MKIFICSLMGPTPIFPLIIAIIAFKFSNYGNSSLKKAFWTLDQKPSVFILNILLYDCIWAILLIASPTLDPRLSDFALTFRYDNLGEKYTIGILFTDSRSFVMLWRAIQIWKKLKSQFRNYVFSKKIFSKQ